MENFKSTSQNSKTTNSGFAGKPVSTRPILEDRLQIRDDEVRLPVLFRLGSKTRWKPPPEGIIQSPYRSPLIWYGIHAKGFL
jgi:hypothetical protein